MSAPYQDVNDALRSFLQLPPDDQRVLLEILRRVVAGAPVEHALEQLTGERDVANLPTWTA